jgi:hypothetical protein
LLILTWGGARFAWVSEPIIGLFIVLLALGAWLGFHLQHASEPLLPMDVLRNPIVLAAAGAMFFAMAAFIGTSVYLPIYFEGMLHLAPSQAGFGLIPLMMGTVFGAAVSGKVSARITHYKRIAVGGMGLAIITSVYLGIETGRLSFATVAVIVAVAGAGVGTLFPIATVSVQNAVEPANLGIAAHISTLVRRSDRCCRAWVRPFEPRHRYSIDRSSAFRWCWWRPCPEKRVYSRFFAGGRVSAGRPNLHDRDARKALAIRPFPI